MGKILALGIFALSLWLSPVAGPSGGIAALAAPAVRSLQETRHHNVVLQQWELSCAAAALATILRYQYDIPVTEDRAVFGIFLLTVDGTSRA